MSIVRADMRVITPDERALELLAENMGVSVDDMELLIEEKDND